MRVLKRINTTELIKLKQTVCIFIYKCISLKTANIDIIIQSCSGLTVRHCETIHLFLVKQTVTLPNRFAM